MNAIFRRTLIYPAFATLIFSIPMSSSALAGGGSSTASQTYGGPPRNVSPNPTREGSVGWQHPPVCGNHCWPQPPVGVVKGTNKGTCKPNGEGCYRQY